jgi:hypothetical protein
MWSAAYMTEKSLKSAENRIKQYQKLHDAKNKEVADLSVRNVFLEGILKCLIARDVRKTALIDQSELKGIHAKYPRMIVDDYNDKQRFRLRETRIGVKKKSTKGNS